MKRRQFLLGFILFSAAFLFTNRSRAQATIPDTLSKIISDESLHTIKKADACNRAAQIAFAKHDYFTFYDYVSKAERLSDSLHYEKGLAISRYYLGKYFHKLGDFDKSRHYYQQALNLALKTGDSSLAARIFINIGIGNSERGNYVMAQDNFEKALKIYERSNDKKGISNTLLDLGINYKNRGNYLKALENYQKSLEICRQIGYRTGVARRYLNIGNLFKKQGDYQKALDYYHKSLEIKKQLNDIKGMAITYINMADVYEMKGNLPQARKYTMKSLKLYNQVGDKKGVAGNYHNLGKFYQEEKNYSRAVTYFKKALRMRQNIGDRKGICSTYKSLGELYFEKGDADKAVLYSKKSLEIARQLKTEDDLKDIHKQLADIYASTGAYQKAFDNYVKYKQLTDSIFNRKFIREMSGMEYRLQYEKEKQAMQLENSKNQAIHEAELKRQKALNTLFIAGLLAAVIIILLFIRIEKIRKRSNLELLKKNEEIQKKNEKIEEQNRLLKKQSDELKKHKENLEELVEQRTAELRDALDKAQKSEQLKNDFLNNISHEFRTPLNSILGFSELICSSGLDENEKKTLFSDIETNTNQLLNIVTDTIDISAIQNGQKQVSKRKINLKSVIENQLESYKPLAEKKNVDIKTRYRIAEDEMQIVTDKYKIERIVHHLLDNAIKFTRKGAINIIVGKTENHILITISDTGIGIARDMIETVRQPFRQAETGISRNFGGNGLGLTIAEAFIGMLGGTLNIESSPNQGTTVTVTLPAD